MHSMSRLVKQSMFFSGSLSGAPTLARNRTVTGQVAHLVFRHNARLSDICGEGGEDSSPSAWTEQK